MNIIREDGFISPYMLMLFFSWGILRCNETGCKTIPATIIGGVGDGIPVFGLCEEHFQRCNQPDGGAMVSLEFDDFDAFKKGEVE